MNIAKNHAINPAFAVQEEVKDANHSVVVLEPLEQGYGHTVGNALRRVLLSSLQGTAITQFRIDGVDHQYDTVKGVTEDVLDISLNLKQVRIKTTQESEKGILRIQESGPKTVTAGDIECEAGFEVVNKDQVIATLSKGTTLSMEMVVEAGFGYIVASDKKGPSIGDIMLDALFSPVVKVSYKVDSTRVGRRTDFDKLVMDVVTDGSISPVDAVSEASKILARQFAQVFNPVVPVEEEKEVSLSPEEAEVLRLTVEELDLPTRIANALRKGGFKCVGDLVSVPTQTIAKVKNLGEKSVDVVNAALLKKGVSLGE